MAQAHDAPRQARRTVTAASPTGSGSSFATTVSVIGTQTHSLRSRTIPRRPTLPLLTRAWRTPCDSATRRLMRCEGHEQMDTTREHEIVSTIDIDAPVERIWEALSSEDGLRYWFNRTASAEINRGGRIEWESLNPEQPHHFTGTFTELATNQRLAIEWNRKEQAWPQPLLLTVEISPAASEGFSTVTMRHQRLDNLPEDTRDDTIADLQQSWDDLIPLREYVEGAGPTF